MRTKWLALLLGLLVISVGGNAFAEAIVLGRGPHLLIDDFLIGSVSNVVRQPVILKRDAISERPIITSAQHQSFQPFFTVLRDPLSGRFRLWYGIPSEDKSHIRSRIAYMESTDGIRWTNAPRVLDIGPVQFGSSVIDSGPGFPNPQQRYKFGWYMDGGLKLATSADGLSWQPLTTNVVVAHNHDINGLFYDPIRAHYSTVLSFHETGPTWSGQRRVTRQAVSTNLLKWSEPRAVLTPDARDEGDTQFYAMDGFLRRGELIIGMVKVLRDDLKADDPPVPPDAYGIGYSTLAWTRNGLDWHRERTVFLDRNPIQGTWDHAHAWVDEQVPVGDEVYLYYAGYKSGHKVNRFQERQIGLIIMKRDRYVGHMAKERGTLRTRPVILRGKRLFVNAHASDGELRVAILTPEGKPIEGFAVDDCRPIRANAVDGAVKWKGLLEDLPQTEVVLEFTLEKATLFAFELR